MIGSLIYSDYLNLVKNNKIYSKELDNSQIQPSSIDLSLSEECYEIKHSFLSPNTKVRAKLKDIIKKKINLNKKYIFKLNKIYLVRLNEKLKLDNNIFGHCNPKSSTGRLDIFCRTIVDYSDEYEKIPKNYYGEIFLEITTRSFNVEFIKGERLNQLRLIYNRHNYLSDLELTKLDNTRKLVITKKKSRKKYIDNGIKLSVNLSNENSIIAYCAKEDTPILRFNKIRYHKIHDFWKPIKSKNKSILIEKNKFYILRSKELVRIPSFTAGEMIPYDTGIGDFRAHYAGFFDPGFGNYRGSYAVLEVKTYELPFLIADGQTIARIKYEKLNKKNNVVYGHEINSNYQNQGLKLSKHFI